MRRWIQFLSLIGFLILFALAAYPLQTLIPVDLFFRIDPLLAATAMLASGTVIAGMLWSILLLVVALFFGRIFCGYVCPLGSTIDFVDHFVWTKRMRDGKRRKKRPVPAWVKAEPLRRFKYYVLVFVLVAALFGVMMVHWFDPFSILSRVLTLVFYPATLVGVNVSLDLIRPLAERLDLYGLSRASYLQPTYYMGFVTLLFFGGILALGVLQPRFWCRNVCPLGALQGLMGRFGFVKRVVTDACLDCGKCLRECPAGAVRDGDWAAPVEECLHCHVCQETCPKQAVRFRWSWKKGREEGAEVGEVPVTVDLSRRGFVASAGAGVAGAFVLGVHPSGTLTHESLIRPPGAVPEELFLDRCIRCGLCMKACTTNTLQPTFLESGLEGLWTPFAVFRYAPCEQRCNVCGQVCPTEAIRPLDLEERKHAKMGTAAILHDRCLVWQQDKLCLICDEQCPYDAIEFRVEEGVRRPFVIEDRCNGCGVCENKCPVQGRAAIVVTPIAAMRLAEGSYIEESRRLGYEFSEAREESERFFDGEEDVLEDEPVPVESDELPPGFKADETEEELELPPGFVR